MLACRPRPRSAPAAARGQLLAALRAELPEAIQVLQSGNIAPVDLPQSTIGPGMRVFSRYARVIETDGSTMRVREALGIVNEVLGEILDGSEADLDPASRFALTWYAQHGYRPGPAGDADNLARAKNTSVAGIERSGIGAARTGRFQLFERQELYDRYQLDPDRSPSPGHRPTVWEATHLLVAALERSQTEAARLLHRFEGAGHRARQLSYLLHHKASRANRTGDALHYNALITAWPDLTTHRGGGVDQLELGSNDND